MRNKFSLNLLLTTFALFFLAGRLDAQYCLPSFTIHCANPGSQDFINNFSTTGAVLNITNNSTGCTGAAPNNYTFYNTMSVSQVQGLAFNFSVQSGPAIWSQGFRIWIDWNQDFDFNDPGEDVYVSPGTGTAAFTGTITVPPTALPGPTRMRVLCRFAIVPAITDYCGSGFTFGECEDYIMNVISAVPCAAAPTAGTAVATPNNPCPGVPILLSLTGSTLAGGLAYQWQRGSSPTGPWVNIGITNPLLYIPVPSSTTWYRCIITCTFTGLTGTSVVSNAVVVQPYTINGACWCVPTYSNGGVNDVITNVTLGVLNNTTTGNPFPFFVNYIPQQLAGTIPIPNISAGVPTSLSVTYGPDANQFGGVWIDWNHSGAFDTTEYITLGTNAGPNGTHNFTITPPGSAIPGQTRMRVRGGDNVIMNNLQPCGPTNSTFGEAEDYVINILPAGPFDPALTSLTAPVGNLCTDSSETLSAVICNYGSSTINLAVNPVTIVYHVNGPTGLTNYTQVLNTGTLGSFGSGCQNSSVTPVVLFSGGNYLINATVSCPSLTNAFLANDSLTTAIAINNYRPTAGPDYQLCQFSNIPFGQGLGVSGCSAPLFDSVTINFTILGPCNDGASDAASCQFATGILPSLVAGASISSAILKITNLATIPASWMSEMRFNVYGSAPTGANIYSPGIQAPGSTTTGSSNFTYQRTITPSAQFLNMFSLPSGSPVNIGYWESFNDVGAGSDININGGGTTVATLKIYYSYVPPSFAWYDVPSGGSSLYTLSPFNPFTVTNAVVNNSSVPGNYTFYAACLGLPDCRVPVHLNINPTPAACQDTLQFCEYAVGANNAAFNLSSMDSFVSCFNSPPASVEYYGDEALITLYNGLNDTLSSGVVYTKVFYPATGCFSSDSLLLEVISIPQFSLPIYTGFACAPNAIDISSLINIFPPTQLDTLYFEDPAFTIPYTGNPHSILVADSLYMIVQTTNSAACKDSATAYIDVLPATNSIASQDPGNFSVCGPVGCGNISLSNGTTETLYTTSSCRRIATVTDDPIDGINLGSTTICEDIDCSVQTWPVIGGQPYVNRHYDITPTNNGKAQVCLYYLNQDFLDYDAAAFPAWPSMIPDSTLCITQVDNGALGAAGSTAISIPNAAISTSYDAATTVWTVCFPVDSFSSFYCHTCNLLNTPLPVSLLSFTGKRLDGTSVLNWETSSEQNNSHFVVERSKDAKSFSAVSGKINSKASNGNSSVTLDYTYTDVTPFAGHNYYRLQQNDIDGQQSYSGTVDVYFGNETFITLYPNPVTTELNVEINTPKATTVYVKIMEATGRIVRTIEMSLQAGNNTGKVDLHSLADGVYMVSITNNKGLHYTQTIRKK